MKEGCGRRPDLVGPGVDFELKGDLTLKRPAGLLVDELDRRAQVLPADVLQRGREQELRGVAVVLLRLGLGQLLL
jgi:hypothetical protein